MKMWYVYAMEYYSTIKKCEISLFGGQDGTGDIMLSEKSQDAKQKYLEFLVICGTWNNNDVEDNNICTYV
jgi:hypothetical protein